MPFRPMRLRGGKIFARCDASGELVVSAGKVEIRYKPRDGRAYFAVAKNLLPFPESELLDDADFGEAAPVERPEVQKPANGTVGAGVTPKSTGYAPTKAEPGEVIAYADGACSGNPGPSGIGVVLLTSESRRELSEYLGHGTNNTAELTAILRAAEAFPDGSKVLKVFTDSSYSIGVLAKGWKAKANVALVASVKVALAKLPSFELHHVRGHRGVPLNERADALAVVAVESQRSAGWQDVVATR